MERNRSPLITTGCSLFTRPISRAMASAVCGWSPVTMMMRMPAVAQREMASGTCGRGGSSSPISPVSVMPRSSAGMPSLIWQWANASTRRPASVITSCAASRRVVAAASSGAIPASNCTKLQAASTVSGAPLQ